MLTTLTSRAGLTATTALVAVGMIAILPTLQTPQPDFAPRGSVPDTMSRKSAEVQESTGLRRDRQQIMDDADAGAVQPSGTAPAAPEVTATAEPIPEEEMRAPEVLADESFTADIARAEPSAEISSTLTSRNSVLAPAAQPKRLIVPQDDQVTLVEGDTEAFSNAPESALKVTSEEPVSTFSIDVDTAAYSVVRQSLMSGRLPPAEAVRVEEMVNYFPYAYPAPEGNHPFEPTVTVMSSPWNAGTNLVHIGIQGTLPAIADRPPLNLVFLIDTSGSMQDATKLPLLKQSFRLMLSELRPDDEISIVTYAGSAGQVLEPTRAAERATILAALDRLEAGGSTAGQAGLQQAYQVAEGMDDDGEVTRVILATDGDFNVGLSDPEALKEFISDKRESGTYLSVLGFGRGNLDDATMQALAQNGNGIAAYIDTLSEAQKVLVDQLTGALFPIANDVKIQVEFNPTTIAEYRLIGYETRALAREDFNNDRVDAGDIGAGHTVTAIYEITPVGSDAIRNGALRYAEAQETAGASAELGFFKLRYKRPGETTSVLIEEPILPGQGSVSDDVRFSAAIAGFGQLLRDGRYLGAWSFDAAIALANDAKGDDPFGYRGEAVTLMRLAEALSQN